MRITKNASVGLQLPCYGRTDWLEQLSCEYPFYYSLYFTARTPTKNLSLSQVSQLSILPKDFVCYTKQTQTPSGSHGLAKDAKPLHLYEGERKTELRDCFSRVEQPKLTLAFDPTLFYL